MTDEERQKLVGQKTPSDHSLGLAAQAWCEPETSHKVMDEELCKAFARILDRALAQSDAEPVGVGGYLLPEIQKDWLAFKAGAIVLPRPGRSALIEAAEWLEANNAIWGALSVAKWLRARAAESDAPPRPDASAGLIEAAEWLEQRAPACYAATTAREWATELRKEAAIRARAADRSGK